MNNRLLFLTAAVSVVAVLLFAGAGPTPQKGKSAKASPAQVARGKYLVTIGHCNDCHSPKVMTPMGPVPDTTRLLSGQPAGDPIPAVPPNVINPAQWVALTNGHFTAWAGPWGVSFAKNLTPDKATGLGSWTEAMFVKAMRTGKDMGEGRQILPPMPWPEIGEMNDADMKAVFAYLQSLPAIANAVPDPIPPAGPAPEKK